MPSDTGSPKPCFAYVTCPNEAVARHLAQRLVEARLAACVNILAPITSVFRWEGSVQEAQEIAFIAKTVEAQMPAVTALVQQHHPYDCACIVALPIAPDMGNPAFLSWIASQAQGNTGS